MSLFKVLRLSDSAIVPKRGSSGAAGYDLYSDEETVVPVRSWKAISTSIAIQVPDDHYARVAPRSGLALKNGINVGGGVVDSDYTGEVKVILFNHSENPFYVNKSDRVAQIIFEKISIPILDEVESLEQSDRGSSGFGSTGR